MHDRRVLVTGATSGIGRATATLLARRGADVTLSGRDAKRGEQVVAEIQEAGGTARFLAADLADPGAVQRLAEAAGQIDVLVNNAGLFQLPPALDPDLAGFDDMVAVNLRAPFVHTTALVPGMIERGQGSIVNVTTIAATNGLHRHAAYGATKAALGSLTRTWAAEFGPHGIRVNAVAPGPTRTAGVLRVVGDAGTDGAGASTLLARTAEPDEIAEAIAFLAAPRSSFVTGTTLFADGGRAIA